MDICFYVAAAEESLRLYKQCLFTNISCFTGAGVYETLEVSALTPFLTDFPLQLFN